MWYRKKGFTLVELLIVVLILGALAAIAIPRIGASAANAKKEACKTNIDVINTQLELFEAQTSGAPTAIEDVTDDTSYFPDGAPVCAVTDANYPTGLINKRVDDSTHGH